MLSQNVDLSVINFKLCEKKWSKIHFDGPVEIKQYFESGEYYLEIFMDMLDRSIGLLAFIGQRV